MPLVALKNWQNATANGAKDYDSDLERDIAWNGHIRGVEAFVRYMDQGAKVIDIGCGAGLAASELSKQGFHQLDGFDLSEGLLAEARKLGIYGDPRPGTLGQPWSTPPARTTRPSPREYSA